MNVKKQSVLKWKDAPDTITPEIYAKIRGRSIQWARDRFNESGFPLIDNKKQIADKEAVQLYDIGIKATAINKQSIDFLILLELKKMNERTTNDENC